MKARRAYMTPAELMQFQRRHGATNVDMALLLGVTQMTVGNLRAGNNAISRPVALLLMLLDRDPAHMWQMIAHARANEHSTEGAAMAQPWMDKTPQEAYLKGRADAKAEALERPELARLHPIASEQTDEMMATARPPLTTA